MLGLLERREEAPEDSRPGWAVVHVAVDDFRRLAYAEVLPDHGSA